MISLSSVTASARKKTRNLIHKIVMHNMEQSAAGCGLLSNDLYPGKNQQAELVWHI